ncbi:MAG: C39 family peptidase [Eubacterium sp.]|nr:C39 family peptidase [Eubacterium sp.]
MATNAYASISVYPTSFSFDKNSHTTDVKVMCADSTWVVGGGSSWCTITKKNNSTATITVTANSGSKRTMGVVCVNGPNVASISISQAGAEVTYDRSSKIIVYKQDPYKCAGTCACMCVKKSPSTVEKEIPVEDTDNTGKTILLPVDWYTVANKYGYSTEGVKSGTISDVFSGLKSGYPVIAYVNDGSNGRSEHWVVVTKYKGNGTDLSESNFTCADPYTGTVVALNKATCFNKITQYIIFKK